MKHVNQNVYLCFKQALDSKLLPKSEMPVLEAHKEDIHARLKAFGAEYDLQAKGILPKEFFTRKVDEQEVQFQ